jgi:hypothetical protein
MTHSKWKRVSLILVFGAFAAWLVSMATRPEPVPSVERMGFAGFTNGLAGPFAISFALTTNHTEAMQAWQDAGTNGATFVITNRHRWPMGVPPVATFKEKRGRQQDTPVIDAAAGLLTLFPGQVATVHVAVLPHEGPWKVKMDYLEMPRTSPLTPILQALHVDREPDGGEMESDWIEP